MKVACICPTFARAPRYIHLVEEAVESFTRQDYDDCELIVYNDCPQQTLVCDAPRVRVVNHPTRWPTLGAKYNAAISLTDADLICSWEDDDICMHWRISQSVEMIGDADYWTPMKYWFLDGRGLHWQHPIGVSHNCSVFRRSAWEAVGGYPEVSGPQDQQMDLRLRKLKVAPPGDIPVHEWAYIYRWGVSPRHLSAFSDTQGKYDDWGAKGVTPGRFVMRPLWRHPYHKMCLEASP